MALWGGAESKTTLVKRVCNPDLGRNASERELPGQIPLSPACVSQPPGAFPGKQRYKQSTTPSAFGEDPMKEYDRGGPAAAGREG